MGFNISGIAINKSYKDNFEELQKEFGWDLKKVEDIDFEDASSNWKEEDICDVYFTEEGTLLFLNMDMCTQPWEISSLNTLTFALSETSMAFNIDYCEKGVGVRSITEFDGNRVEDEGGRLKVEEKSEDTSEIIWNLVEEVIGKRFLDIEADEKAVRYHFVNNKTENTEEDCLIEEIFDKFDFEQIIPHDVFAEQYSDDELLDQFYTNVEFAQKNKINLYLFPIAHGENGRRFINFQNLINEIANRPEVQKKFTYAINEQSKLFCRIDPDKIDQKTYAHYMSFVNHMKRPQNEVEKKTIMSSKKWWEFWK